MSVYDEDSIREVQGYAEDEPDDDDGACPGCRAAADEECDPECEYYEL